MTFEVDTAQGKISFTKEKLVEQLLLPILKNKDETLVNRSIQLVEVLISKEIMKSKLIDMFSLCFMLGYYYNSFLTKNKVEIKE